MGHFMDSGMEAVAKHLQDEAMSRAQSTEGDLFGRSAFNRYYYATYLEVRRELGVIKHEWGAHMDHATIPDLLRGQLLKGLTSGFRQATKIHDKELITTCSAAMEAAKELAKLMERGRGARVTADYNPQILVKFNAHDFELNSVRVSEAKSWPPKAKIFMNTITRAWKYIND